MKLTVIFSRLVSDCLVICFRHYPERLGQYPTLVDPEDVLRFAVIVLFCSRRAYSASLQSHFDVGYFNSLFLRYPRHQIPHWCWPLLCCVTFSYYVLTSNDAVKLHREQFWKSISKYLISERIIWKMAYGIRCSFSFNRSRTSTNHLTRHKEAIKRHFKPSVHQFQNAWHWILDKHANPNVDVAAYDIGTGRYMASPFSYSLSVQTLHVSH